jgi:hypothetical protein
MTTDFRALCARMADELDHYLQLLTDNRLEVHSLAAEARAALSAPEQGPTDEAWFANFSEWLAREMPAGTVIGDPGWWAPRIAAELLTIAADLKEVEPVPVSERPWERDGWCDKEGMCWMGDAGGRGFVPSWRLCKPSDSCNAWSLPHWALPVPQEGADGQH